MEAKEEDELSCDNSCLICLQQVAQINEEQFNSLNFFFNYLKINSEIKEAFVCEECEEKFNKFVKVCKALEKVRLEMDYLLDFIKSAILTSSDVKPVSEGITCVRKRVVKRCKEEMWNPKPAIILQRVDLSNLIKVEVQISEDDRMSPDDLAITSEEDNGSSSAESEDSTEYAVIKKLKKYKMERKLKNKKERVTSNMRLNCLLCSKTFLNKYKLKMHTKTFHHGLKQFKCSTCLKEFSLKQTLNSHIDIVHLRLKPYLCDICGRSFAQAGALRLHKAIPHPPKPETYNSKTFICQTCKTGFSTFNALQHHQSYIHAEKRHSCPVCNKMFNRPDILRRHVSSIHHKTRQHCQAPGCDKNYACLSGLKAHYKLCHPDFNVCQRPRKNAAYLETVAQGESFLECKLCKEKFKTVDEVEGHIKSVHGAKKFLCEDCGYATTHKNNLTRHIASKHKSKNPIE